MDLLNKVIKGRCLTPLVGCPGGEKQVQLLTVTCASILSVMCSTKRLNSLFSTTLPLISTPIETVLVYVVVRGGRGLMTMVP